MARQIETVARTGHRTALFWMVPALIILAMIPIRFQIAGQLLNPQRLLLLIITPYLIIRWIKGDFGRLVYADYAITFFCFWMTLSIAHFDPGRVVGFAGSNTLQVIGGYLVGRAAVRSAEDFFGLAKTMAIAIVLLLPMAFYESVLNNDSPILEWLGQFRFIDSYRDSDMCCRMGLNRAQTVFIHPIHYGIFCALGIGIFFLGLTNQLSLASRLAVAFVIAAAVVFSVSSGALITMGLQLLLIGYALAFHSLKSQWKIATRAGLLMYVILELNTTKIAFFTLSEKLAFSSHNAYTRQIMVKVGIDLVERFPFFGWGLRNWPLPYWMHYSNSIDNYWLVLAGSYGLPTFLSAISAFIVPLFFVGGNRLTKGSDLYWIRLSWTFMIIGVTVAIATVFLWDVLTAVIYMMLGAGMFLMYATEPDKDAKPAKEMTKRQPRVYSRFSGTARPPVTARRSS